MQGHMIALLALFKVTSMLFSTVAAPTHVLIDSTGGFQEGPFFLRIWWEG